MKGRSAAALVILLVVYAGILIASVAVLVTSGLSGSNLLFGFLGLCALILLVTGVLRLGRMRSHRNRATHDGND